MSAQLMTYYQILAALLVRYQQPVTRVAQSQLDDLLAERVFRPTEVLLQRVNRLGEITARVFLEQLRVSVYIFRKNSNEYPCDDECGDVSKNGCSNDTAGA
jgi:hypothetical protein